MPLLWTGNGFIEDYSKQIEEAEIVIAHAGIGVSIDISKYKKTILVPRRVKLDELVDNHQVEIANALEKQGRVLVLQEDVVVADLINC